MSKTTAIRDGWRPQTSDERETVMRELHQILSSPHFCNSKRYPALLRYIVESTLEGKSDRLKERTLGIEVFDRPPSYDTNADTVVRYTAGEVRKRLSLYYHEHRGHPALRISLPAGSYVPEFLLADEEEEMSSTSKPLTLRPTAAANADGLADIEVVERDPLNLQALGGVAHPRLEAPPQTRASGNSRLRWFVLAVLVALFAAGAVAWNHRSTSPSSALETFWAPVFRDHGVISLCSGSVVFANNNFSGVTTASKDIDYPFVSMQIASSIAQISGLISRNGSTAQLLSAASTPLTELREHPIVLLGGYNNEWTLRLVEPLRYHFSADTGTPSILDRDNPQIRWARDHSLPYSSADDYLIVARFREVTTDSWVMVLAGLGRNGTEAATQFVTSPHYMQLLRDRVGASYGSRNVEAVLKVNVIDGKTGSPTILAVHAW